MTRRWLGPAALVAGLLLAWNLACFTVPEWMQAVVVQLGNPIRTVREPGLYFKIPFIQQVLYFDRRLLVYDAAPKEILTRDKQQLVVDNYSRWRIEDPLRFYRTVRSEAGAQSRLDDIVYSNVRETLGRHPLHAIVSDKRDVLMREITRASDIKAREYGIVIVDVRIKRADLPEKNERNVFQRMRAERERQAKKFRAEGAEEARKIRSQAEKEVEITLAEARKQAEIARGEGDARAARIYAEAYSKDADFFAFQRSLRAYDKALDPGTTLVLSTEADFLRYLKRPSPETSPRR